jgi:hypothetical protein
MFTELNDILNFLSIINEEITASPCSYTRQMGSATKIRIIRHNQTTCQV